MKLKMYFYETEADCRDGNKIKELTEEEESATICEGKWKQHSGYLRLWKLHRIYQNVCDATNLHYIANSPLSITEVKKEVAKVIFIFKDHRKEIERVEGEIDSILFWGIVALNGKGRMLTRNGEKFVVEDLHVELSDKKTVRFTCLKASDYICINMY